LRSEEESAASLRVSFVGLFSRALLCSLLSTPLVGEKSNRLKFGSNGVPELGSDGTQSQCFELWRMGELREPAGRKGRQGAVVQMPGSRRQLLR